MCRSFHSQGHDQRSVTVVNTVAKAAEPNIEFNYASSSSDSRRNTVIVKERITDGILDL
jgi:hypothetical protein